MYNSLVLASLLPLTGPAACEQFASSTSPIPVVSRIADPGDLIPVVPQRTRVAYASDGETADRAWSPAIAPQPVTVPVVPAQPLKTANTIPVAPPTFASTTNRPNVIELTGRLSVPKRNQVPIAAPFQAQLASLRTVRQGADGQPVLVPLREGMHVVEGQVLGNLDTRLLEAELASAHCKLKVAEAEANNEILLEYAQAGVDSENSELAILSHANAMHEGAIAAVEINRARLRVQHAIANYRLEEYKLNIIKREDLNVHRQAVKAADEMIRLRQLVSPISGMIVKISKAEGEWLREGDEVLEIVQLDTLRLILKVDASQYDPISMVDKAVSVTMPFVNGKTEVFPGKVVFVNPSIDPGNTFDVYVDVQNRPSGSSWLLLPGEGRLVSATIKL